MSILLIYVPEAGFGASCDWALRAAGTVQLGTVDWDQLPPANQVVLILAASRVLFTQVQLPAVGQNKMREILAFAVEDKLLTEPDKVHTVASARKPNGETAVAIIDKAWLRQQLAFLRKYGLQADKMLAETLLPPLENNAWSLVWNGQGGFIRSGMQAGFVVDGGDAQTPPMALTLALDEACAGNTAPERILIYQAPGASTPNWPGIKCDLRGNWTWQNADTTSAAAFNLLQGEFAPQSKARAWTQQWRPAFALIGVIVAVHFLATLGDWIQLKREHHRLQSAMVTTFKQAFPEAAAIVDPALQMSRNLAGLQRTRGIPENSDFLPLLAQAAPLLRQGHIQSLQYTHDQLTFDLLLSDAAQLDDLRQQLHTLPLRSEIGAPNATTAGTKVRLSLGMNLAMRAQP